ncbi:secreted RxLR effector protein 161-like [Rutidosis leptorrhynchoides]|uniref:secreted RxLR effector protein 161-like n=1 Tax=Rutidosis leptorrhynchoides TaxID=125765 RepID=UPI003A99DB61
MTIPEGYYTEAAKTNKVCKLTKYLYGLEQAPRQWNEKLNPALVKSGFVQRNSKVEINKFKVFPQTKFMIKDLGSKPIGTPIECNANINYEPSEKDSLLVNMTEYQKLVVRLIYLTLTRPDISFVVQVLSQYMHAPLQSHLNLVFRTLKYLKNAPGRGINLVKVNNFSLHALCDSDWGKRKLNRKSVTSYLVYLCNSLVSWKSKKQTSVARSSAEAEYRAMATVACEVIWIKNLLLDLNIKVLLPV